MLEVVDIKKSYHNKEVLCGLSFSVKKGEVFGLLGVNGAGKTTALNIISGYLNQNSGKVLIDGISIKDNPVEYKNKIGYLPDKPPLYDFMTVYGYLDFVCRIKGVEKKNIKDTINFIAQEVKIDDVLNRLIGHLSKGYRQRIGLAQAFLSNPELVILDEPTQGLDPVQINEMNCVIKKLLKNTAVVLSSHILDEVSSVCDKVMIINNGKAYLEGAPADITEKFGGKEFIIFKIFGDEKELKAIFKKNNIKYKIVSTEDEFCILEFETTGIENAEFFIGKHLFEGGYEKFSVVEKRRPTLNDVFLSVVGSREG